MNQKVTTHQLIQLLLALILFMGCVAGEIQDPKKKGSELIGLSGITPSSGISMGGYAVVVSGFGFTDSTTVSIGGVSCPVISRSSSQIACTVGNLGSISTEVDVVVSDSRNGSDSLRSAFSILGNPVVTSVSPRGSALAGGGYVVITGANFTASGGATTVTFGGTSCANVTYLSSTSLSCQVPAHAAGLVDVVVTNPGGLQGTGSSLFEYLADPTIASVTPNYGVSGGGTTVTITGTNFSNNFGTPTVVIGGVSCSSATYVNATTLTCVTGAMSAGTLSATLTNPSGQSATLGSAFTAQDAPTLTSVTPSYGSSAGGTTVTINGANFSTLGGNPTVMIGTSACSVVSVLPGAIQCTTSAATVGAKTISVTNADTQSGSLTNAFTYQAAPSVSAISPVGGATTGATTVTITGANFSTLGGNPTVTIGGTACTVLTVPSSSTLTCQTGAHATGVVDVVVTNQDSQAGTGSSLYEYRDAPTYTSISPVSGPLAGGITVTINGSNFSSHGGNPIITLGGTPCYGVNVVTASQLTCITGSHSAGLVDLAITNRSALSVSANSVFTYQAAPTISSISPQSGIDSGGTSVTITGTNFSSLDALPSVSIGGISCGSVVVNSSTSITCTTAAGPAGIHNVSVTNADSQVGYLANGYQYQATPTIASISPLGGPLAGGGTLTITGTGFSNFDGAPSVNVGGNPCTSVNYISSTQLTCTLPAGLLGSADVQVVLVSGLQVTSSGLFTYQAAPTFGGISPSFGDLAGSSAVTVTGTNFSTLGGNPTIMIGTSTCGALTVVNATTITCSTTAGASAGAKDVVVTNADGQAATGTNAYTYLAAPTITSISPVGGALAGGTTVNIVGTNFSNLGAGPSASINGVNCQSVTFNSSTSLDCLTDAGVLGIGDVIVTNPDGQSVTGSNLFEYRDDPTYVSVSPVFGPDSGGTSLTITGTNFSNHTADPTVTVAGVACASLTFDSATQLTCVTGSGMSAGASDIVITNSSGQSVTGSGVFEVLEAPVISSISPVGGVSAGGGELTITGSKFSNLSTGPTVLIGANSCTPVTFDSATQLRCTIPAGVSGATDVTVTNPDSISTTGSGLYEYLDTPTFVSVSPTFGAASGGTSITITGTNFSNHVSDPSVTVDGVACGALTFNSATSLTCTTGTGMNSGAARDIVITNSSGETVTGSAAFTPQDAPTVTSISPNYGALAGGTTITITGTNFSSLGGLPSVDIGGVSCGSVIVDSATQIRCDTGVHTLAGAKLVTVTNQDSQSGTLTNGFTYQGAPTVTAISPVGGVILGSTGVTITGTNFSSLGGLPNVKIGAVDCTGVAVNSDTEITCTSGSSALGTYTVTVTNADTQAGTSASALYEYRDDPTFVSAVPAFGVATGGTSVTITGTNFTDHGASPTVTVGGTACASLTYTDSSTLTCVTPAGMSEGNLDIVITNQSTQTVTAAGAFEALGAPTLTGLSPDYGTALSGPTISLIGTKFSNAGSGPSVTVGGVACTTVTYVSSTQVDCVVPAALTEGVYDVVYTGPAGATSTLSNGYHALGAPTVSAVSPVGGDATTGGTTITITGTKFSALGSGATVTVGGVNCGSVVVSSDTQIQCQTGAHAAGVVDVVVTNPDTQAATLANSYHYLDAPTISGVSPNGGPVAGGTTLAITGTNFSNHTGNPTITVAGVSCSSVVFNSSTQIDCVTPAGTSGAADVVVTNPSGQSVSAVGAFTYADAPTVSDVTPKVIASAGGTTLTITGTGFLSGAGVKIGASDCTSVNVSSTTTITCDAPAGTAGYADVIVTNADTQTDTLSNTLIYESAPTLLGVSPSLGPLTGGQTITLTGTDFGTSVSVTLSNGGGCTSVTRVSDTSVTCVTTAVGSVSVLSDVTLTNTTTSTSSTLNSAYNYIGPPTVASISPSSGGDSGGDSVTVTGTDFEFPVTVTIGGVPCTVAGPGDVTSTSIVCTTGAGSVGSSDVRVTNPDGQSDTLAGGFTYTSDAVLAWQGGAFDFGSSGVYVTQSFTLENTGSSDSQSIVISLSGANSSYFQVYTDNCGGTVVAGSGGTCTVEILWRGGSGTVPSGGPYSVTLTASGTGMTSATVNIQATKP